MRYWLDRIGRLVRGEARRIAVGVAERARTSVGRATAASLRIRALVFTAALAALLLSCPAPVPVVSWLLVAFTPLALVPAVRPAGWSPAAVMFTAAGCWFIATAGLDAEVRAWRVTALACSLYLLHASAALAAVVPFDAVVPAGLVCHWAVRPVVVLATTGGLAGAVVGALAGLSGWTHRVAAVCGAAAATGVVALLAVAIRAALPARQAPHRTK